MTTISAAVELWVGEPWIISERVLPAATVMAGVGGWLQCTRRHCWRLCNFFFFFRGKQRIEFKLSQSSPRRDPGRAQWRGQSWQLKQHRKGVRIKTEFVLSAFCLQIILSVNDLGLVEVFKIKSEKMPSWRKHVLDFNLPSRMWSWVQK